MKKITSVLSLILVFAFIIGMIPIGVAAASESSGILEQDCTIESIVIPNNSGDGYIPYNTTFWGEEDLSASSQYQIANRAALPAKYDSRTDGIVTPVRDQKDTGTCWAFASMAVAEIATKKQNKSSNPYYSVNHVKTMLAKYYITKSGTKALNPYGSVIRTDPNSGGNYAMTSIYMVNGYGPTSNSSYPFVNDPGKPYVYKTMANFKNAKVTRRAVGTYEIPGYEYSSNSTTRAARKNNYIKLVKENVKKYGAVGISYMDDRAYENILTNAYYHNVYSSSNGTLNHTVTVVGWDDSFSRSNFLTDPGRDGAFIVKNSWGTEWHNKGYFYMSYADEYFYLNSSLIIPEMKTFDTSKEIVKTYAEQSVLRQSRTAQGYAWVASRYYTGAGEYEKLDEVGFHTMVSNTSYKVYLCKGSTVNLGTKKNMTLLASGKASLPGFQNINVANKKIILGGDDAATYYIVVRLSVASGDLLFALEDDNIMISVREGDKIVMVKNENPELNYIKYKRNGVTKVEMATSELKKELKAANISYSSVATSYYTGSDTAEMTKQTDYNFYVSAKVSKYSMPKLQEVALKIGSHKALKNGSSVVTTNKDAKGKYQVPQIVSGSTMIPFRFVANTLGAAVSWDQKNKTITVKLGKTAVKMVIGSKTMTKTVNGKSSKITLSVAPCLIDGSTYIPLRAVASALGCNVYYVKNKSGQYVIATNRTYNDSQKNTVISKYNSKVK